MIHDVFNEDLLTQCKKPQSKGQYMEPALPSDIINEEEEYKVKEIKKYQNQRCRTEFLVYWKEYENEYDQWIAEIGLSHAKEVIEDY